MTAHDDLAALNASDGQLRWKDPIAFPGDYQVSAAAEQNVVYVSHCKENWSMWIM